MGFFQEINHPSTGIPCYGNPLAAGRWTAEFPNPPLPSWLTIWCLPDVEWMWATLESFCITYEPIYSPQRSKPAPALNMSIHMDLLIYHIYIYISSYIYIIYISHIYIIYIYISHIYIIYIYISHIYITYIYISYIYTIVILEHSYAVENCGCSPSSEHRTKRLYVVSSTM